MCYSLMFSLLLLAVAAIAGLLFLHEKECYKDNSGTRQLVSSFLEQCGCAQRDWEITRDEAYNKSMSFVEAVSGKWHLLFSLERYRNRTELRLVDMSGVDNAAAKKRINDRCHVISTRT